MNKEYFVIKIHGKLSCVTTNEAFAKSQVGVFCSYEKVELINVSPERIKDFAESHAITMSCGGGYCNNLDCGCCGNKIKDFLDIENRENKNIIGVCLDCYLLIEKYWRYNTRHLINIKP